MLSLLYNFHRKHILLKLKIKQDIAKKNSSENVTAEDVVDFCIFRCSDYVVKKCA